MKVVREKWDSFPTENVDVEQMGRSCFAAMGIVKPCRLKDTEANSRHWTFLTGLNLFTVLLTAVVPGPKSEYFSLQNMNLLYFGNRL